MKMKLVVLAVEDRTTWLVANSIHSVYSDVEVLLINNHKKFDILISRYKKSGLFNVLGQLLFVMFSKIFLSKKNNYIDSLINKVGLIDSNINNITVTNLLSGGELSIVENLKKINPDVIVVNGTRILSQNILNACNAKFINLHCGITPAYRGVHGAYWALYNNDREHCGVTIHEVDTGIDTGVIYYQDKISISSDDNFHVYPFKQYIVGIPLLMSAIDDISRNRSEYLTNTLPSKLYQHPTIINYLYGRLKFGVK